MKLFLFAASTRKASWNKKLIQLAATLLQAEEELQLDCADFAEFAMPLFDGDLQEKIGLPENAVRFIERMEKADAVIISSPEYNFSIPGTLKNCIDWVSRKSPMPFTAKPILLMSASPSVVGGNRGLWATRVPLEACGAYVFAEMFSLSVAHEAFQEDGQLKDAALQDRLRANLTQFLRYTKNLVL